jgi:hypothetical protein
MMHHLAHLEARAGDFDAARALATRSREIALETGQLQMAAVLWEVTWDVESLAGDDVARNSPLAPAPKPWLPPGIQ